MYSHQQDSNNHFEHIADQIKKGTTTCALTCNDGIVTLLLILEQVQVSLLPIDM